MTTKNSTKPSAASAVVVSVPLSRNRPKKTVKNWDDTNSIAIFETSMSNNGTAVVDTNAMPLAKHPNVKVATKAIFATAPEGGEAVGVVKHS